MRNRTSTLLVTESQAKIRTQWRMAVLSTIFVCIALVLALDFFNHLWGMVLGCYMILALMKFSITWLCAYRKPGTKWLSYTILMGIFFLPLLGAVILGSGGGWPRIFSVMFAAPFMWYYVASWRLRGANKAIQEANFLKTRTATPLLAQPE